MPARHIADLAGTRRSQFRIKPDTAPGSPTTGSHLIGEIHTDSLGALWHCIVSGSPGTWEAVGSAVGGQSSLPTGLQVIDSLAIASNRTIRWAVEVRKASRYRILEIVASHDGTNVHTQIPTSFQFGTGANDIVVDVDISGGNIRLIATPSTTGWTLTWKRVYAMPA